MTSNSAQIPSTLAPIGLFCASILLYKLHQQQHEKQTQSFSTTDPNQASQKNKEKVTKEDKDIPTQITLTQEDPSTPLPSTRRIQAPNTITIAYASTTGTCEGYAKTLQQKIQSLLKSNSTTTPTNVIVQLLTVDQVDWWDELLNEETEEDEEDDTPSSNPKLSPMLLFVLPTWTNGTLPEPYNVLLTSLSEIATDWRIAPQPLKKGSTQDKRTFNPTLLIGAFGMGSKAYDEKTFGKPAKSVFATLMKLGARSLVPSQGRRVVCVGDEDGGDAEAVYNQWLGWILESVRTHLGVEGGKSTKAKMGKGKRGAGAKGGKAVTVMEAIVEEGTKSCQKNDSGASDGGGCACREDTTTSQTEPVGCCSSNIAESKEADVEDYEDYSVDDDSEDDGDYPSSSEDEYDEKEPDVMDLEDIGIAMQQSKQKPKMGKEMVTPKQATQLKKEGYKIIGTHSAVKLCRWTKHQLRGRGGCYKHTFYGITSYQCMEATPSLACANKCVFCWRHHKNPVGREWRWKVDDPHMIVQQAVDTHVSMIKEAKGIPGVQRDRWEEAHTVRHCALSLVGEPIMYPRIDEFLADLHERNISTFLVTNGQHPDAIDSLRPITQLYVSVDASTPETLEEIDRPLFKDAWERLRKSLKCLKNKGQRTVARLTVVKGWNSDEISGYAKLIALGHCSLVELKGVTFCGKSDASNLNMSNSPWHHEVVEIAKTLQGELAKMRNEDERIPEYDLACEHKHSCSVLLARVDQFAVEDPVTGKRKWRTWINYEKFQQLAAKNASDPTFTFGVEDYVEDTPEWALAGAAEEGFDPTDTRHRRKKKHPKYTQFDKDGVPTHDHNDLPLSEQEIMRLKGLMAAKKREIGDEVSVVTSKAGEKIIDDASLMFRGLVITK